MKRNVTSFHPSRVGKSSMALLAGVKAGHKKARSLVLGGRWRPVALRLLRAPIFTRVQNQEHDHIQLPSSLVLVPIKAVILLRYSVNYVM